MKSFFMRLSEMSRSVRDAWEIGGCGANPDHIADGTDADEDHQNCAARNVRGIFEFPVTTMHRAHPPVPAVCCPRTPPPAMALCQPPPPPPHREGGPTIFFRVICKFLQDFSGHFCAQTLGSQIPPPQPPFPPFELSPSGAGKWLVQKGRIFLGGGSFKAGGGITPIYLDQNSPSF